MDGETGEYWIWWYSGGVDSCEERKTVGTGRGLWISDPRQEIQEGTVTVQDSRDTRHDHCSEFTGTRVSALFGELSHTTRMGGGGE